MSASTRRATLPLPPMPADPAATVRRLHPISAQAARASRRPSTSAPAMRRPSSAVLPAHLRALNQPRPRSLLGSGSTGGVAGQWQHSLRTVYEPIATGRVARYRRQRSVCTPDVMMSTPAVTSAAALENSTNAVSAVLDVRPMTAERKASWCSQQEPPLTRRKRSSLPAEVAVLIARRREEAAATLQRLFVPLWRLHRHRRRARAAAVARRCSALAAERRAVAVDAITAALRSLPLLKLPQALRRLRGQITLIQRCARRHSLRIEAAVELNYRHMRKRVEAAYWADVVAKREEELLRQQEAAFAASLNSALAELEETQRGRRRSTRRPSRINFDLDVYNFYLAGRMPELLMRREIRRAVVVALQRSAAQAVFVEALWQGELATTPGAARARRIQSRVVVFLPETTCRAIMDNVVYLTSQFRDESGLRSHLRGRSQSITPY